MRETGRLSKLRDSRLLGGVVGRVLGDVADVFVPFAEYGFAVDVPGWEQLGEFLFDCDCLPEMQDPRKF